MPRVLRIINRLNLGGPTYNAALLTKYLSPEFETLLVAGYKQDSEESSEFIVNSLGIRFTQLPEMKREINFRDDWKAYRSIRKIIREFKPDIVHTHAAKSGTLGRLAAFHEKVPVVVHTFHGHVFHSYFSGLKTKMFLEIERYLARKSTAIIAISRKQKEELTNDFRICRSEKVQVIPLGFDLQRFQEDVDAKRKQFRDQYFLSDDEVAVGIIGRLVPVKNHTFFLKCMNEVMKKSSKKIRVFIIGDGEERERLLSICRELRPDCIYFPESAQKAAFTFTSWIKDIDRAIAGLDIVALTSFNEGTPVSLIEAQAGSKPVVSSKVGGIEDIVAENSTGFLFTSNDAEGFTTGVLRLAEDPNLRAEFGYRGLQYVSDRFHFTRLVSDTRQLYLRLLK